MSELIVQAEHQLWDLAAEPAPDPDALGAAWPRFQQRSHAALLAAAPVGAHVPRPHYNRLAKSAEQAKDQGVQRLRDARPHPGLARASRLLGAAADLLQSRVAAEPGLLRQCRAEAWQARIAQMIVAAAHTTRIALTRDPGGRQKEQDQTRRHAVELGLIEHNAAAVSAQVLPTDRRARYANAAAQTARLTGPPAQVLALWQVHAAATLSPSNPAPSMIDTQRVTTDLTLLTMHTRALVIADAQYRGVDPDLVTRLGQDFLAAARGWAQIHAAWPAWILGAADPYEDQAAASDALHTMLNSLTRPGGRWRAPGELIATGGHWPSLAAAFDQALAATYDLATDYTHLPGAHAETGTLYTLARSLPPAARRLEHLPPTATQQDPNTSGQHGRWAVLQPGDLHAVTTAAAPQPGRTKRLRDHLHAALDTD